MALRIAVICGMTAAIAVPVILARTDAVGDEMLLGRLIHLPLGGGVELRWSWPVFCITTLAIWALLAVTRER